MNKNIVIAAIAGIAMVAHAKPKMPDVGTHIIDSKTGIEYVVINVPIVIDGKTNLVTQVAPLSHKAQMRPLEPEATKRLHKGSVEVSSFFEASGRADWAELGGEVRGSYIYTVTVKAQSEVKTNVVDETTGRIHVEELRTFTESRPFLSLSDIDAALALDTLPVDQVHDWCINAGTVTATLAAKCGRVETAASIAAATAAIESGYQIAKAIDGMTIRGVLGIFGVKIPEDIDIYVGKRIAEILNGKIKWLHAQIDSIEGKSFLISYDQEASGKPLDITYRNTDGSPISDAEWEILRQANLFLDQNVLPDTRCHVGDEWLVWADEVQNLFGIAGNGRAEGRISVTRVTDRPNGDWTLKLSPTDIAFRSDAGTISGKMQLTDGNGIVDHEKKSVRSLHATATGDIRSMDKTRHAMFFDFVKRFRGKANFRFNLAVEPVAKKGK